MSADERPTLEVGRIIKAQGLKGQVLVDLWTDRHERLRPGAELFDASGVSHGKVVDVEANPASDILVLDSGALVPLTFVTSVEANVRIDVDVPDGLFE